MLLTNTPYEPSAAQMNHDPATPEPPAYVELARLQLRPEEFAALRRQGFVRRETRGPRFASFKLRFRAAGRQRVVYLGIDPATAQRVAMELAWLQRPVRRARELRARVKAARQMARALHRQAAPVLEDLGLRFHGLILRKTRPRHGGGQAS